MEYVLPGNTTTLEARVHATPQNQASVRWYHEERFINDATEPRYTVSSDGDIYRLVVSNIGNNEVGRYTIVASLNGVSTNDTALISFPRTYDTFHSNINNTSTFVFFTITLQSLLRQLSLHLQSPSMREKRLG